MAFGIQNDDALFSKEMALPDKLRSYLNVYRFQFITGEFPSVSNVLDRLHLAGSSLLQAPLGNFELSVRATNIFTSGKIGYTSSDCGAKDSGAVRVEKHGEEDGHGVGHPYAQQMVPWLSRR